MTSPVRLPIPEYPRRLSSIVWIELDHQTLADWFRSSRSMSFETEPGPGDLTELLVMVDPEPNAEHPVFRYVLFPAGRWTGLVNNARGDIGSDISMLLDHPTKMVQLTWETVEDGFPGGRVFSIRDHTTEPTPWPFVSREVRVIRDQRWSFEEYGDPLPFEDLDAYKSKRITERLTGPQLMSYATALGIPEQVDLQSAYVLAHYFETSPTSQAQYTAQPRNQPPVDLAPARPPYPNDLEIGTLLSVEEFFTPYTNQDDIGCNLEHHPGIGMFRAVLHATETDPTTSRFAMHVSDTDENGYPFCDAVFVTTTSVPTLRSTAAALSAELLQTDEMAPPLPPFDQTPPGTTTVCLWWD